MRKTIVKSWMLQGQAQAAMNRHAESIATLRRAVTVADEIGHGSLRWQTRAHLARSSSASGESDGARAVAREAADIVSAIVATLTEERLRSIFMAQPLVLMLGAMAEGSAMNTHDAYPAGLTGREVEVLRLVAQGATNKDVAQRLHISVKTVNAHLNNIFNKTDSPNRAAAAAFAMQHGLA
jgi:DNA-binding CsgD family transcriptional regulator